jgi:hypothetical protein
LIFYDTNNGIAPNQPPNVVEQALAETNTLAIALGVSLPLVAIIVVAIIIFGITRMKRVESREFARVKNKIKNSQSFDADGPTVKVAPPAASTPAASQSGWKTASKTENLSNLKS